MYSYICVGHLVSGADTHEFIIKHEAEIIERVCDIGFGDIRYREYCTVVADSIEVTTFSDRKIPSLAVPFEVKVGGEVILFTSVHLAEIEIDPDPKARCKPLPQTSQTDFMAPFATMLTVLAIVINVAISLEKLPTKYMTRIETSTQQCFGYKSTVTDRCLNRRYADEKSRTVWCHHHAQQEQEYTSRDSKTARSLPSWW